MNGGVSDKKAFVLQLLEKYYPLGFVPDINGERRYCHRASIIVDGSAALDREPETLAWQVETCLYSELDCLGDDDFPIPEEVISGLAKEIFARI